VIQQLLISCEIVSFAIVISKRFKHGRDKNWKRHRLSSLY